VDSSSATPGGGASATPHAPDPELPAPIPAPPLPATGQTAARQSPPIDEPQRKKAKTSGRQKFILRNNLCHHARAQRRARGRLFENRDAGWKTCRQVREPLGYKCNACSSLRDPRLNGSGMAAHLNGCRNATYEVGVHAWDSSKPLGENKPHPMGGPLAIGSRSSPSNAGLFAPSLPVPESASNRTTIDQSRITTFVDGLSPSQMDFINKGWLLLFVQNRSSFRAIESPSFFEAVLRTRPACVTTGRLPSRRILGGWMLDDLYMDLLVSWAKHGIVTLALDGWEDVSKSHVVNFQCISGGAAIFLDIDTVPRTSLPSVRHL
jgi:hypothetical protein